MLTTTLLMTCFLVIPPTASLMVTHHLKEKTLYAGLPYPLMTRLLVWTLYITIAAGVITLALALAIINGDPNSQSSVSLVSTLNLVLLVMTPFIWIGAYVSWYATPIVFWSQAHRGDSIFSRISRRRQLRRAARR